MVIKLSLLQSSQLLKSSIGQQIHTISLGLHFIRELATFKLPFLRLQVYSMCHTLYVK
jgi:hypothetical protein